MRRLQHEIGQAKPYFLAVSPGWPALFKSKLAGRIAMGISATKTAKRWQAGATDFAGVLGGAIANQILQPVKNIIADPIGKAHQHLQRAPRKDPFRKNGLGGRGWLDTPGRYPMTIVFHDANRAGPHVDVHIGRLSMIYRVKPEVYEQLRTNGEDRLTKASKQLLLDFVREEIEENSRVPQNLDHSIANGKVEFFGGTREDSHYGAGLRREIIETGEVDVFKTGPGKPIEMYAPALIGDKPTYIFRLYNETQERNPILIWGKRSSGPPPLFDRLHLTLVQPDELEQLETKADMATSTAKYDGSSCYLVMSKRGTRVFSPRTSKKTGEQIEYTHKLGNIATNTAEQTTIAMGELLFVRRDWLGRKHYVSQSEGGGVLNANRVRPRNLEPEIRLYRVDKVGREVTVNENFWLNRQRQTAIARQSVGIKVVELMHPNEARERDFEGVVVVPGRGSVNEGFKTKWWTDPHDWRIDRVDFHSGPTGKVAGVLRCTSLESGNTFKLGPGQVGDEAMTREMMRSPESYEGTVLKVHSRHGFEGRASRVVSIHTDKGTA